jgi:hypothetical protein
MTLRKWKNDNFGVSAAIQEHAKYNYRTTNHHLMASVRFVAFLFTLSGEAEGNEP